MSDSTFTVHVYLDSPLFASVEKWWMLRRSDLLSLYVATYECGDLDRDDLLSQLNTDYPSHVLIYA
jgi:hypothetical protein